MMDVVTTKTHPVVPNGKTLLIGGQKIARQITNKSGMPMLPDLPLIGRLFSNRSKTREQQTLFILVKPTIEPH
jgi:type II secretory pathway component GspD/PulD (secretin)